MLSFSDKQWRALSAPKKLSQLIETIGRRHLGIILLVLLGTSSPSAKSSSPNDHRNKLDSDTKPWFKVGKLIVKNNSSCTAALVGPDTVITAAHCLYNFDSQTFTHPSQISFLAGYEGIRIKAQSQAATYTVSMKQFPNPPFKEEDLLKDWAIIKLREPMGCMLGHFELWDGRQTLQNQLISAGYGKGQSKTLTADTSCKLYGKNQKGAMWRLKDCESMHGDSGAPVFSVIDQKLNLIGIMSASAPDEKGIKRSFVVPIDQFQKTINKHQSSCNQLTPSQFTGIKFKNPSNLTHKNKQLSMN